MASTRSLSPAQNDRLRRYVAALLEDSSQTVLAPKLKISQGALSLFMSHKSGGSMQLAERVAALVGISVMEMLAEPSDRRQHTGLLEMLDATVSASKVAFRQLQTDTKEAVGVALLTRDLQLVLATMESAASAVLHYEEAVAEIENRVVAETEPAPADDASIDDNASPPSLSGEGHVTAFRSLMIEILDSLKGIALYLHGAEVRDGKDIWRPAREALDQLKKTMLHRVSEPYTPPLMYFSEIKLDHASVNWRSHRK